MPTGVNSLKTELHHLIQEDELIFDFIQQCSLSGFCYSDLENPENEWMNVKFWTLWGYKPEEVLHKANAWQNFLHRDDFKVLSEVILINRNNPSFQYEQELRYTCKKGNTIWILCKLRFLYLKEGKPTRMLMGYVDITPIKELDYKNRRLEVALKQSEERFRNTIITSQDIHEVHQIEAELRDTQQQLIYKSQILSAIATTTEKLVISKNIHETLQESFDLIGNATHVDRVYYFEYSPISKTINYKIEWVAENVISAINDSQLHDIPLDDLAEYMTPLLKNELYQNFTHLIQDTKIRQRLTKQKTLSILLFPIFVKTTFHGFIGFDDCKEERIWSEDQLNAFRSMVTIIANAIERQHNELAIQESENNFREINETIEDVFLLFDNINRKYLYASPSCEKMLGASQSDFYAGIHQTKVQVVEEDKEVFFNAEALLFDNNSYDIIYRLIVDGQIKWINEKAYAIRNNQGQFIRNAAICTDITEKVEKQNQLEKLLHVTYKQNDRLMNFAHIVSHNIRSHSTNLSSLIDFMEITSSESEKNLYLSLIKKSIHKLGETIENLNEIITIQNNLTLPKTILYLKHEIDTTINALASLIQQSQATLHHDIEDNISILGIPAYLESILLNLLTNAIKYRSPERNLVVNFSTHKKDNYLILSIQDNGLGIDLNKHGHKLFGMYKTFHTHKDSRGIGLFITKNQIEAMGGKIEVESEVGVGTIFHIYFML